tara:strand:+ start:59 stop:355 length:297 start_codon:yes stop_codon:yes gene_type:complete
MIVTIQVQGHTVEGSCDFCGPHSESGGAVIHSVKPANEDDGFLDVARLEVEQAAASKHLASRVPSHNDYDDYMDYDDDYSSSGPDYWQDPESGEYRCG